MKKPKVSKTRTDPHTGEKVKLSTEAWKARQAESDANWEAQQGKEHKNEVIRDQRRIAYPKVGDQLDAIWKQLNQDRLNGKELIQEADDHLNEILKVKKDHPKV